MYYFQKKCFQRFHFQTKNIQSKYVNVLKGKILDIVIDLRKNQKHSEKLLASYYQKNALGLYIPAGFAHAYLSLDYENIIYYKLNNYYNRSLKKGLNTMIKN